MKPKRNSYDRIHNPTAHTLIPRSELPPGAVVCDHCIGKCCRYFSLPIKTPEVFDDYDEIFWFLAHGRTSVYVSEDTWYLLVMTPCRYLTPENRCGIYADRPKICQDHSSDNCEYDDGWTFEKLFETPEQIREYAQALFPRRAPALSSPVDPGKNAGPIPPLVQITPIPPRASPTPESKSGGTTQTAS